MINSALRRSQQFHKRRQRKISAGLFLNSAQSPSFMVLPSVYPVLLFAISYGLTTNVQATCSTCAGIMSAIKPK